VKVVHFVFGTYDFVVKVEAETAEKLKETVTNRIRRIANVSSTLTMMVVVAPSASVSY
jgi:DNA-binding Lrp family transcriptional regulator